MMLRALGLPTVAEMIINLDMTAVNVPELVASVCTLPKPLPPPPPHLLARLDTWLCHAPEPLRARMSDMETMIWAMDCCLDDAASSLPSAETAADRLRRRLGARIAELRDQQLSASDVLAEKMATATYCQDATAVLPPFVLADDRPDGKVRFNGMGHLHAHGKFGRFLQNCREHFCRGGRIANGAAKLQFLQSLLSSSCQLSSHNTRPFTV
jgi:hypothetical protein